MWAAVNLPVVEDWDRVPARSERNTAMGEHTATGSGTSTVAWADLHDYVRTHVQQLIQKLLEDEITELPGRSQSERRTPDEVAGEVDPAYRNGYGKPRQLTTPVGTLTVRRPRVRGLEERFESASPSAPWAVLRKLPWDGVTVQGGDSIARFCDSLPIWHSLPLFQAARAARRFWRTCVSWRHVWPSYWRPTPNW